MVETSKRRTVDDLLAEARSRFRRLAPAEAHDRLRDGAVLIDTRCAELRRSAGTVPGSIHIPLSVLLWRLDPDSPHRDQRVARLDAPIILFCADGYSSSVAAGQLRELGFTQATDIDGGFEAWRAAGLPVEPAGTGA